MAYQIRDVNMQKGYTDEIHSPKLYSIQRIAGPAKTGVI